MDIFVDWGSTNFRAFLTDGECVAEKLNVPGHGVLQSFLNIPAGDRAQQFSAFLAGRLEEWLKAYPEAEIFMCGAIGSREGWVDTGYVDAPADPALLARNFRLLKAEENEALPGRRAFILPGLAITHENGRHDVMRSEETKSLGAAAHLGLEDAVFCVPGTHCKWVWIENGAVTRFHSLLTGELYAQLSESGFLSSILPPEDGAGEPDFSSFKAGLDLAQEGYDLLADIWQVRCQKLRSGRPPADLRAYFSGILIGHELKHISRVCPDLGKVVLLGDKGSRQDLYRYALKYQGWNISAEIGSETAVCAGLGALLKARR